MKTKLVALLVLAVSASARHVIINNYTEKSAVFNFNESGQARGIYTLAPGSSWEAEIPDDVNALSARSITNSFSSPNYYTTEQAPVEGTLTVTPGDTVLWAVLRWPSAGGTAPSLVLVNLGYVYTGLQPAPSLTYDGWQAAMAAGLAVWIIPIFGVTIMRIAKRGARTGGTVL